MRNQKKYLLLKLLFLLILIFPNLFSQYKSLLFDKYKIENGLSNNSINSITQTPNGFLWIATSDGLNSFDGESFKIYKHNKADSTSLPENYLMSLLSSKDGTLWIGTWGSGLVKFNPNEEKFLRVDSEKNDDDFIETIYEDNDGIIWCGSKFGGLIKFDPKINEIKFFTIDKFNSLQTNYVTSIVEDKNHFLWLGTINSGLLKFDKSLEKFEQYKVNENILTNNIYHIFNLKNESLILSTTSGLYLFNLKTKKIEQILNDYISNSNVKHTLIDKQGRAFIGLYNYQGLFLIENYFGKEKSYVHHFINEDDNLKSISSDRIKFLFEDFKGNIWIATEDGLNKLPNTNNFLQYRFTPLRKTSVGGRIINSIFENKNNILWIGIGGGGIDKINLKTNEIYHFKNIPNSKNSLNSDDVTAVFEDSTETLWIGLSNNGLDEFNLKTKKFIHHSHQSDDENSIRYNWVQQIFETKTKNLLIGTNEGIDIFNREKKSFERFEKYYQLDTNKFLEKIQTNFIFEDKHNDLWIGTWLDGLIYFSPKNKIFKRFLPDEKNPNSISTNRIISILEDSDGLLWIGTYGGGLNKFDRKTEKFTNYSIQNGFPNDVIFGILEDEEKFLWISTLKGLIKFNPKNNFIRIYDEADGIVNNQFHLRSFLKNKNGEMYFGGSNGFVSFKPEIIKIDSTKPKIAITKFKIFNDETKLIKSITEFEYNKIELSYSQNFFSFDFAMLDFFPTYKNNFAFKLDGYDPDWNYSGRRASAFYTNVNSGNYTFLVKASNQDGIWSEPIKISITIIPAWWMTNWFKLIMFLFFFLIFVAVYKFRIKQLLEIERIRLNISTDLHDEIGSNISSISVDSQLLLQSKNLDKTERELLVDINKNAIETNDTIRDIIWFINPKNYVKEDVIFKMKEIATKLLVAINWNFEVSAEFKFDDVELEKRRNIFLIFKESITNVLKHSKAKNCKITISKIKNNINIIVDDDGIGFNVNNVKLNNGLINMQNRANKIGAILNIESKENYGTKIELTVPIKK